MKNALGMSADEMSQVWCIHHRRQYFIEKCVLTQFVPCKSSFEISLTYDSLILVLVYFNIQVEYGLLWDFAHWASYFEKLIVWTEDNPKDTRNTLCIISNAAILFFSHQVFADWNKGELDSFLIEITKDILAFKDSDGTPLVEKIRDSAGQVQQQLFTTMYLLFQQVLSNPALWTPT